MSQKTSEAQTFAIFVHRNQGACLAWFLVFFVNSVALLIAYWWWSSFEKPPRNLEVVAILSGVCGAATGTLQKIYSSYFSPAPHYDEIPQIDPPSENGSGGFASRAYQTLSSNIKLFIILTIPSSLGAFYALILYIVLSSGLVNGELFPKFACDADKNCNDFADAFHHWSIVGPTSFNKLIFWCFLAGYIEQFMPNMIDGLHSSKARL